MAATRTRVALIGAGEMGNRYHYPSLASFPDVELVANCDSAENASLQRGHALKTAECNGDGSEIGDRNPDAGESDDRRRVTDPRRFRHFYFTVDTPGFLGG